MISAQQLIETLRLEPHPEGGYYRETYRSKDSIPQEALAEYYTGSRACSTAIYYLLPTGSRSRFHRLKSDEFWHFYLGDPVTLVLLHPNRPAQESLETIVLGHDLVGGQEVQVLIPAGCWFGAFPNEGSRYSLVGCTVSPGFDFGDFEIAEQAFLLEHFPHATYYIQLLTDEYTT